MSKLPTWLLVLLCGGPTAAGIAAWREGRFADAAAAFAAAESEAGDDAPAALLLNRAYVALKLGRPDEAEAAAERAAARGGPSYYGVRDFVLGSAAYQRATILETRADLPNAGPRPFDGAIAFAEAARDAWARAAATRADWPAARRNVERAILKIEALRERRDDAERNRESRPAPEDLPPPPPPPPPPESSTPTPPPPVADDPGALDAAELKRLLERLAAREREKREVRREDRAKNRVAGERDW
jgi:hypothetical protein